MSYIDQRASGRDAKGMTAAVLLHGAAIAAVLLAPAAVREITKPKPIAAINVRPLDPPPPPEADPIDDAPAPPETLIYKPEPLVELPRPPIQSPRTSADPQPIPLPVPGFVPGGTGTLVQPRIIPQPTPAPPVLHGATRDPRYAANFQPPYPSGLLRREIEGTATVRVLIGPDGRVSRVAIVSASEPEFGKAAERQALAKWRFRPATEDGTPVPSWQTLTVRFTITN
ncbi:TonB family protein [Novosphingopyxis sp.]|uniref:energy transducer TonB n=1 Tax=Novosphingopyxis sp. TaxID=2709690 RepID=UPI003B599028